MKLNKTAERKFAGLTLAFVLLAAVFLFLSFSNADVRSTQDYSIAEIQCRWRNVDRIIVIGDLHGAYENFVKILKQTDLIDEQLQWIGGKSHLVQIGDILDRGDRARDIFDLLIKLEESAKNAGGFVHVLIGNHEEMNLTDTAFDFEEYITPNQFISFLSDRYIKKQERVFRRLERSKRKGSLPVELDFTQYWTQVIEKGKKNKYHVGRRSYFRNLNRTYGRWILNHNVVVKINDVIFVHAGITEPYSKMSLEDINKIYRLELDDVRSAVLSGHMPSTPVYKMNFYNNPNGPLWTRDFVKNNPESFEDDVGRILINLGANHMIIGHSPVFSFAKNKMSLYDGKIWAVDTGISDYYLRRGGFVGALVYEKGKFSIWADESLSSTQIKKKT
ncbi:MAG: metallophosphoesterase [Candidatus Aminicenantes bacterium]|nr:metallophosphoesterase [Candidatus Aminicenantes bacterium]